MPAHEFWARVREELILRPEHVARMCGIPELANLRHMDLPRPPLKLPRLRDLYVKHSDTRPQSKGEACRTFDGFMKITGAETLDDLTTEALKAYRDAVRKRVKSPATVAAYFGRCKWIIAFAKSEGEDPSQIDAALSPMAVLKAPRDGPTHTPTPISREDSGRPYRTAGEKFPASRGRNC